MTTSPTSCLLNARDKLVPFCWLSDCLLACNVSIAQQQPSDPPYVGVRRYCGQPFPHIRIHCHTHTGAVLLPFLQLRSNFGDFRNKVCHVTKISLISSHLSLKHEGCWGTMDDFVISFLHFSLFSTALWDLPNSRPVHSLMFSSHFCCLPCLLPPFTVPCKMVLARPDERDT